MLASVLKPINDTRMYGKLSLSLAKLPHAQIHLAGYQAPLPPAPDNLHFHPLFKFKRLSLKRFLAPLRFLKLLFKISPQVVIVGTHELIWVTLIYKIYRRCDLVYDVRENYYLNLKSQKVYVPVISHFLAFAIRGIERLAAPFVKQFLLAEKSYAGQLPFLQSKYLVLENKYQPKYPALVNPPVATGVKLSTPKVQLLYTGTISELYGVFEAVALCQALNQVAPGYVLTIMGYCPQTEVLQRLKNIISGDGRITLIGGDYLVPHHLILEVISESHVGLLPYHPHPSTAGCIPTKLYEYIAQSLPVIVAENTLWENLVNQFQAGIVVDFNHYQATDIHAQLHQQTFYAGKDLTPAYWVSEEKKLLDWANTTI